MKVKYFMEIGYVGKDGRELVNQLSGKHPESGGYFEIEPAELQRYLSDAVQRIADKAS